MLDLTPWVDPVYHPLVQVTQATGLPSTVVPCTMYAQSTGGVSRAWQYWHFRSESIDDIIASLSRISFLGASSSDDDDLTANVRGLIELQGNSLKEDLVEIWKSGLRLKRQVISLSYETRKWKRQSAKKHSLYHLPQNCLPHNVKITSNNSMKN